MSELWPHQLAAKREIVDLIRSGVKRICVAAPTGAGKTRLAAEMALLCNRNGGKTLFLAPKVVLVQQTLSAWAERTGLPESEFGVLQAGNTRNLDARYLVGTPQTLATRGLPAGVRLVVVDECHKRFDAAWAAFDGAERRPTVIGLTATPYRAGMGDDYGALVKCSTTDALVEGGVLCGAVCYAAEPIDTKGLSYNRMSGDYGTAAEIEERTTDVLAGNLVGEWEAKCRAHHGGPVATIAFSRSITQGKTLVRMFRAAGHDFRQVHSGDDAAERDRHIADFRAGRCVGLVSCDILAEGFDAPGVRCVLFARPTRSLTRLVQAIGRGQRGCEGKAECLVIDMTDALRRNLPALCDHWRDGPAGFEPPKGEADGEAPAKACPVCGAVVPLGTRVCPQCGHEFASGAGEYEPGQLARLPREELSRLDRKGVVDALRRGIGAERRAAWRLACGVAVAKAGGADEARAKRVANGIWRTMDSEGCLDLLRGRRWHPKEFDATAVDLMPLALEFDRRTTAEWKRARRTA